MIDITVNKLGTLKIEIIFTDEDDVIHALSSATSVKWQLSDKEGNVIGTMSFANGLITESPVMLSCSDLEIGTDGDRRIFAVEIIYDSTNGTDLCGKEEFDFKLKDLKNWK